MAAMPAPVQCSNCLPTGLTVEFRADRTSLCIVAIGMILVITSSGIDLAVGPVTVIGTFVGVLIRRDVALSTISSGIGTAILCSCFIVETAVVSFARQSGCRLLVVKQS
jgi:ribose/xylose/arabinose/galactoside ABC-type transport system permease subunit